MSIDRRGRLLSLRQNLKALFLHILLPAVIGKHIGSAEQNTAIVGSIKVFHLDTLRADFFDLTASAVIHDNVTDSEIGHLSCFGFLLSNRNVIISADRVLFLEIIENTLFLRRQLRVSFKERNKHIKCALCSILILRLIERVLRIAEDTLVMCADMVYQRTAARAFTVTNIKATLIAELLTVNNSSDREVRLFIPARFQLRNIALRVLFLIEILKNCIAERKTAIRVCKSKIVNDVAFANPFITVTLAEAECQAVRLFFGLFRLKFSMILFLCDDSKCLFSLHFITENIIESFLDTVELREIIALFPISHSSTVKLREKITDSFIGNIGNSFLQIVTHPPESEIVKFLMDTVNESLSDLLKGNKTLHTAETAIISVLSPI